MNVEQRILTALRRQQPDRVPVLSCLNPYVEDWYTYLPTHADVLRASERYADVVYDWRYPVPLMFTAGERWTEQRDLGGGRTELVIHTPDGPVTEVVQASLRERRVLKRCIQSTKDVDRVLSLPYVASKPGLDDFFSTKQRLVNRAVARATFREPIAISEWIDEERFGEWCHSDRAIIRRLLDTAFERITDALRTCLEAGVGPIYSLSRGSCGGSEVLAQRDFEEFVVEYDRRLIEQIHTYDGRYVLVQGMGKVAPVIDMLVAIGMDGLHVTEPPARGDYNLAHVKARLGDRVCLIADLPYDELRRSSTAQIERQVRHTLAAAASGGGLILNPCDLPREREVTEMVADNLVRYLETAHDLGTYPIRV
jgi:uroporphyrinogen-III decarboxylase